MACLFHLVAVVQCYHPGFKHQTKFSIIMAASEIEAYEWNCRPLTLQDIWAQQHVMSSTLNMGQCINDANLSSCAFLQIFNCLI